MVFDSISSNIDEVLLINPFANVLVFGDLNFHHQDWLTYSGGTGRPGEFWYNFSISNDLTQLLNFPTQIPDCDDNDELFLWYTWLSDERLLALFPAGTIVRDPHHCESLTYHKQDLNQHRS